jgi:hypothetical protein
MVALLYSVCGCCGNRSRTVTETHERDAESEPTESDFVKYGLGRSLAPELLPRLIFVVAVILFGVILIMFGFLAEMITMVYYRERTPYRIEEISVGRPAEDREDGDAS